MFSSSTISKLIRSAFHNPEAILREMGYWPTVSFGMAVPELVAFYRKQRGTC